jgi:hypothetical protein
MIYSFLVMNPVPPDFVPVRTHAYSDSIQMSTAIEKSIQLAVAALALFIVMGSGSLRAQAFPDEALRHLDRGQAAVEMAKTDADFQDAAREFQKAADMAPNWPVPYYNLAVIQNKLEQFDEAAKNFRRYLQLSPDAPDAAQVRSLINKLEYRKEKADKERADPNRFVGLWDPGMDNGGAFYRFQIINSNGTLMGAMRPFVVTEERGLSRPPVFVPIQWDGSSLVIPKTRYFYCDKSVQPDCCPAEATLTLTSTGKDTLEGSLRIGSYRYRDGMVNPESVSKRTWKRGK